MYKKILIVSTLIWGSVAIMAQQDKKIAILDPVGDVTDQIKEIVREEISSSIMNIGGYTVFERSQIDQVLKEYTFRLSDLSENSQFREIGTFLGANYVFVTSISPTGGNYHLSCKVIDVSSGRIDKQTTKQTTKGGMNDLIVVVQKAINEMFQKETELALQGRKIFANNTKLDDKKIQNLMANTEALKYYNKSKSQKKTGTGLVWAGVAAIVVGVGVDLVTMAIDNESENGNDYIQKGDIIYGRDVIKLRETVIGGATGAALIGTGIVLRSSSKKSLQKSVDMYNSTKRTAQTEIRLGVTGNGIGLAINF